MADHPISGLMSTAMENIKNMVDVNTIVGDPVTAPDGTVIIPISKVSFGFAAGGSEFAAKGKDGLFGGGSGGGVSIHPVAFMVVGNGHIRLLPIESANRPIDKLVDYVPELVDKLISSEKFTIPIRSKKKDTGLDED